MGGVLGLVLLDETVVGVALPTIREELGLSEIGSHWVVNAYLLVFACLAAAAGKLGDLIGLRALFSIGVTVFGGASLLCGFAENGAWLIAARSLQGVGAAAIFPCSISMVAVAFPERQHGMALGLVGGIGTTFLALGPLVGGFFTQVVDWRWIFWINPALALIIGVVVAAAWANPKHGGPRPRIDLAGLVLLIVGLALLVFGLMQAADWGWATPMVWGAVAAGAAALGAFVWTELAVKAPLIEVDLFRNLTFTSGNLLVFLAQFTKITVIIFGALYFQNVLGMSPLWAGAALLPSVVPTPFSAVIAGRAADRAGLRRPALGGLAAATVALAWLGVAVTLGHYAWFVPALLLWGGAMGFVFAPARRAVMASVPLEKRGQSGGINMTAQLMGGTIGMAVCSTLLIMTGDYRLVFFVTAGLSAVVWVTGWFSFQQTPDAASPSE